MRASKPALPAGRLQGVIDNIERQTGVQSFHTLCVLASEAVLCRESGLTPGMIRLRVLGEKLRTACPVPPPVSFATLRDRLAVLPARPLCLSYGCGVDSTAVLVHLARQYRTGNHPECRPESITFADTGNEKKETYEYMRVINAFLRSAGFPEVTVVRYRPTWTKNGDYHTLEQNCLVNRTLPSLAFGFKKCSLKWKRGPQDRHRAKMPECRKAWAAGLTAVVAIGYDAGPKDSCRSWDITDDEFYEYWYPLIELGWDRERCLEEIRREGLPGWESDRGGRWLKSGGVPAKSACWYCLAGETEVVTDRGIREIRDLAERRHNLLVPLMSPIPGKPGRTCLNGQGKFLPAEIKSFGVQPLTKVTLSQRHHTKTLYATAEHRWFVWSTRKNPKHRGSHPTTVERLTRDLLPGDKLRELKAGRSGKIIKMPFAIAQGFVFGDGTKGTRNRPASLHIYDNQKDDAMLPYFAIQEATTYETGKRHIYGLPRMWKMLPTIRESKSFLVSWLSGYFAADGEVSKEGVPVLSSASLKNVEFVRNAVTVCGISHGKIGRKWRKGIDGQMGWLYRISIDPRDLPEWFFLIRNHAERANKRRQGSSHSRSSWTVKSVEETERVEEVFCAVVPGVGAFGLADGLMTGNCPSTQPEELDAFAGTEHGQEYLRAIIRMEANAAPNLTNIEGLWRKGVKGTRGGKAKPGSMTRYIHDKGLLAPSKRTPLPVVPQFDFCTPQQVAGVL